LSDGMSRFSVLSYISDGVCRSFYDLGRRTTSSRSAIISAIFDSCAAMLTCKLVHLTIKSCTQ
jgi:hypothetical protein